MSKYLSLILIFILTFASTVFAAENHHKIIVIVPIEHEAMNQIVSGIKESVKDAEIIVHNAQGDPNIMLALIKQAGTQNPDIIMPIGTSTSQMTIAHIHNKPIICVAADLYPESKFITGVNDEIPVAASLDKFHKLRNIAVIYSSSEKVFPEVKALKAYGAKHNVKIHEAMIQAFVDLPSAVRSVPEDVEAFLILKDHLIVSGINVLIREAKKREIPVIASDEGSVINGATLAIGVKEKSIGMIAGNMANEILNGKSPSDIAYKTIEELTVFTNAKAFAKQKILNKEDIEELKMQHIVIGEE